MKDDQNKVNSSNNENKQFDSREDSTNQNKFNQIDNKQDSSFRINQNNVNNNFIKNGSSNFTNKSDSNRLSQVLNKKKTFLPRNNLDNNQMEESNNLSSKIDSVGEQAVEKFGGKAITAATAGAISGPVADAIAKKISKPTGKMLKYILILGATPILLLLVVIIPVLIGSKNKEDSSSSNSYSYVSSDEICSYKLAAKEGETISNIKVRLLNCETNKDNKASGTPIDGSLIDFEYYIAGVVNQEIGNSAPEEAIKAQAIAARSFALTRLSSSRLKKEGNQWILEMKTCTEDQVYCDPVYGCNSRCDLEYVDDHCNAQTNGTYGQGGTCHSTVYSGNTAAASLGQCDGTNWNKAKMSTEAYQYVVETNGQIALNSTGEQVAATPFGSDETNRFTEYANDGLNANEIIKKVYGENAHVTGVSSSCETNNGTLTDGPAGWKQCDPKWKDKKLGNSNTSICTAGCAATSVAIQLALSKVEVNFENLNPGTFVEEYTKKGGFDGDLIYWNKTTQIAPKFIFEDAKKISGTKKEKAQELKKLKDAKKYVVIGVYKTLDASTPGHWVALDKVSGNTVYIYDPGQSTLGNKMFDVYRYTKDRDIFVKIYKIGG